MGEACLADDREERDYPTRHKSVREDQPLRLRQMVADHIDFLWRSLRRFGIAESDVDDAVQSVFLVAARRLADISPMQERSFLFATAHRVASDWRRARRRRPEDADEQVAEQEDHGLNPEQLVAQQRTRQLLDEVLDAMSFDVRVVFVLFELEEMSTVEIAKLLEIPAGTVASRLRRGREEFQVCAKRLQARLASTGDVR